MLWAGLLHDITKRGMPIVEGKDHIHPFTGSSAVLTILLRLEMINVGEKTSEEKGTQFWINEVQRLISESVEPAPLEEE